MRRHDKKVFFLAPERGSSREEDPCGSACFLHAGIPILRGRSALFCHVEGSCLHSGQWPVMAA